MNDIPSSAAQIFKNIAESIIPIERLVSGAAYMIGLTFVFKAIYSLKIYGEQRSMMSHQSSIKEPVIYAAVGALLIYLPTAVDIVMNTTFGYSSILAYAPVGKNSTILDSLFGPDSALGGALGLIIQLIGLIAFVRGWVLIARAASQGQPPGGTGKGIMHVFGGILAMNIVGTLQIVNNTLFGTS